MNLEIREKDKDILKLINSIHSMEKVKEAKKTQLLPELDDALIHKNSTSAKFLNKLLTEEE